MRHLLLILLCLPMWAAELPTTAARAVTTYDKEVAKAKAVYEAAVATAKDKLLKKLNTEKTRETKAGRLETALAIKNKIDSLTEGVDILGNPTDEIAGIRSALVTEAQANALDAALKADSITEQVWNKLPGKEYKIICVGTNTKLPMKEKETYVVIPHPTDTWNANFTWRGDSSRPNYLNRGNNLGGLVINVDKKQWCGPGKLTVEAKGSLCAQINGATPRGEGSIRIKVLKQK